MSSSGSGDEIDDDGDGSKIIQIDCSRSVASVTSGIRKIQNESKIRRNDNGDRHPQQPDEIVDLALASRVNEESDNNIDNKDIHHGQEEFGFDLLFLRRFFHIHGLLFLGFRSLSTLLFIFLLSMSLLDEFIGYQVGLIASKFYSVLGSKDLNAFWKQTAMSIGIICAISFSKSTKTYLSKLLTVTWRQLLSKATHRLYFADIHYYQLNVLDKTIDNPDQRITQDIDKFCSAYGEILPKIIIAPFVIGYYSYQSYVRSGWHGPLGCFVFFIMGSLLNKLLMSPIVRLVVSQEKCEGDFRFIHLLVRVNSESIAFHNAAKLEVQKANQSLDTLVNVQHQLYCKQYFLNFAVNFFSYAGSILSYLVLAVPLFSGVYDDLSPSELSELISANAFVNIYLISSFTSLVDLSRQLTDVAGVAHRIAQLLERINALRDFWKDLFPDDEDESFDLDKYQKWINLRNSENNFGMPGPSGDHKLPLLPAWTLENISISPPLREDALFRGLTLQIFAGESLLVIGNSSAGKTSFLRLLRGLWPHSEGRIQRHLPPGPQGVFYAPQKPYLTVGTIREQVCFPLKPGIQIENENEVLTNYLNMLSLMPLLDRVGGLDVPVSWNVYDSLSPGEMQRLSFLRIFYHRPMVAVLDEATSALPMDMEDIVCSECQRLGITMVSVGHRESLRKYHEKVLTLDPSGDWTLQSL